MIVVEPCLFTVSVVWVQIQESMECGALKKFHQAKDCSKSTSIETRRKGDTNHVVLPYFDERSRNK